MSLAEESRFTDMKISGRLPTPKGVALEVIALTQKEDVSNQEIIRLISTDAALSLRVLKAANILMGYVSRPVASVTDAVMVLGARALRQLVLGISLMLDYRHGPCKPFDYGHYWTHSLLTGIVARHLAMHARLAAPDEMFMVGLLSRIGRLALATVYAEQYGELLEKNRDGTLAELKKSETAQFGFNEMELSEAILGDIRFPAIFQMLVREYQQPDGYKVIEGSREWRLLHMLHIAGVLAEVCMAKPAERSKVVSKLRFVAARVGIEADALIAIGDASRDDWKSWSEILAMGKLDIPPFVELLAQEETPVAVAEAANVDTPLPCPYLLRVLVVDDDRIMLALLESKLKAYGHTVYTASNGEEAIRMIAKHTPQIIIADWVMPKMDGVTLCRKLREHAEHQDIYYIVMTAQEETDKLVEAFEAGADDYLVKPINTKIFFARLRAGMRVVKLQEELADDREQLLRISNDLRLANDRLHQLALTDVLTSLPNRRAAMERLEQEWAMTQRGDRTLSCLMIDVDHFKSINDKHGHPVGDLVLKQVAHTLRQSARAQDVVCRFGGEEFLVICPDTDANEAYRCAERLRLNVQNIAISGAGLGIAVTVSVGVATKTKELKSIDEMLTRSDQYLYAAKQGGRNRTEASEPGDSASKARLVLV